MYKHLIAVSPTFLLLWHRICGGNPLKIISDSDFRTTSELLLDSLFFDRFTGHDTAAFGELDAIRHVNMVAEYNLG